MFYSKLQIAQQYYISWKLFRTLSYNDGELSLTIPNDTVVVKDE